jgi:hypothetical protein
MKNIVYYTSIIFTLLLLSSCEDVIDVELQTAAPKLVVEANINWQKGTTGSAQNIKLSTTTTYFSNTFPKVNNATVTIKNSVNNVFVFTEQAATGIYKCLNFVPQLNETYTLTIVHNGQTYVATETLKPVTDILDIEQDNQGGFLGDQIDVKAFYKDPANISNFYLYNYSYSNNEKPDFQVDEDLFFQGNTFFSNSQNSKLKKNDIVTITHFGISQQYYSYLRILLSIAGNTGGGPFQSPPATVKGNVVNQTNFSDFPLGYFSLSESDTENFTIQ